MNNDESLNNDIKNILIKNKFIQKDDNLNKEKKEYNPSKNMEDLMNIVDNERNNLKNKTWSKIDKSKRLQLLLNFISEEIERESLNNETSKQLKNIIIKAFNGNLLNKQTDIKYDHNLNKITNINILSYNKKKEIYELKTRDNKIRIAPKSKSKTNIDKLLNNSK